MSATVPSTRAIAKIFFVVVGLSTLLYLLYLSRSTIGLIVISGFLAIALGPPVDYVSKTMKLPRWLAILAVYVVVVLFVVLVGLIVVPPIVDGVESLADDLPGRIDSLLKTGWVRDLNERYDIINELKDAARELPSRLGDAVGTLQAITLGAFSAIAQLFVVLVMTFLLLLDGPRAARWVVQQLPASRRPRALKLTDDVYRVVAGYVGGSFAISVAAGTVTYVTLRLLDVPFAAPLAIMMAFLDLIPLIGATIGGLIILGVSFVGDVPRDPIIWAAVMLGYQQLENNFLQPLVYRRTISVHPLLVIVAVLIGAGLLGVLGALLAIPVAAMLQVVAVDYWELRQGTQAVPTD